MHELGLDAEGRVYFTMKLVEGQTLQAVFEQLDGVVVDDPIALYYIKQHPNSGLVMNIYIPGFKAGQALAFKKGSPLRDEFNKIQNEMKKDGTLLEIHKKWFGTEPPKDSSVINIVAPYMPNEKPEM